MSVNFPTCCGSELPEKWRPGESHVIGSVWWCGDEHCDCTQAQIDRVTMRAMGPYAGVVYDREAVWRGTFYSYSNESPWLEDGKPSPNAELNRQIDGLHGKVHHYAHKRTPR